MFKKDFTVPFAIYGLVQTSTFDNLRVAFYNVFRRVLNLPWRCSASAMYANFSI